MSRTGLTRKDAYELITARILTALEKGTVPRHQPWTSQPPANLVTRKPYRGVNVFVLACSTFPSPWWATYRQVQVLGGHVRRDQTLAFNVGTFFDLRTGTRQASLNSRRPAQFVSSTVTTHKPTGLCISRSLRSHYDARTTQ